MRGVSVVFVLACSIVVGSAQLTQVGIGGFGNFYDTGTAPCNYPCSVNGFTCSAPSVAVPTTTTGDATVEIELFGDFSATGEDMTVTCEGYALGTFCDGTSAGWSNDCGGSDCGVMSAATQVIPQASWAAIIADGSVDCTIQHGSSLNCICATSFGEQIRLDFTFTAGSGGGGDPHIFTPNLPTHADLFEFVQAISGRGRSGEEHMDVNIISSSTVTVTGHISNKPATDKHYFTAFTVATPTDSIRIGFESLGGIAQASLSSSNAEQLTCASARRSMENDSVVVTMDCSEGVQERASSNAVVAAHFQSHASFARAAFTVETEDFELELFFVQKDQASPGFGFFDFSVAPKPGAQELGGLFTNSPPVLEADRAVGDSGTAKTAFILANVQSA